MAWTELGAVAGSILTLLTIAALVVRWALLPYLRDQLVTPIRETHRQVTQHTPTAADSTLVDRLDDLSETVTQMRTGMTELDGKVTETLRVFRRSRHATDARVGALSEALDRHIAWASEEDHRMWGWLRQLGHHPDRERGDENP